MSTGVGNHQMMACQFIRWTEALDRHVGIARHDGLRASSAIGAQVANPDKTVLLIDGDGSFNMTLNDLGTVLENQLPLKMAIMNDHKQQMVVVWQKLFFDGRTVATNNVNPDFVALAQAYGIEAFKCDHADDLPAAIDRFVNAKGPVLCDFRVVPDICLPMVAPGKGLDEMFLPGDISDISLDEDALACAAIGDRRVPRKVIVLDLGLKALRASRWARFSLWASSHMRAEPILGAPELTPGSELRRECRAVQGIKKVLTLRRPVYRTY